MTNSGSLKYNSTIYLKIYLKLQRRTDILICMSLTYKAYIAIWRKPFVFDKTT